jgi:oligopeptidase A
MSVNNPLLGDAPLPLFDQVRPEHVVPAMNDLIEQAKKAQKTVTQAGFPAQWQAISGVLDVATERMGRAWSTVSHLNSVADSPALRAAYNEALPEVTAFFTDLGADESLYAQYKAIDETALDSAQKRALELAKRNFVLSGADLQGVAKERFTAISARMAELTQKFSENSLDATDGTTVLASPDQMQGIPDDVATTAQAAAKAAGQDGYLLTLKLPCYLPVMQFATHRALRETMYKAYSTRASDQAQADKLQFDNTAIMDEILALRQEESRLLGFDDFAHQSIATKMADSPQQVTSFLRELAAKARPFALQDVQDMRRFAKEQLGIDDPQAWDWPFIGERLKEARYEFNEQEVKQYFTAPKVLAGLFKIVETLFDVAIRLDEAPVWHPDVAFYRIESRQSRQLIGQFYLDPSARSGKRGGAWMDDVRGRWLRPDTGQLQTPVAHLICNFASGVEGKPALLTHDDVTTLFHEFGHGLHHLLTQVTERDVAGINGVEWDAVELPSQFMENFCWEWDVVRHMTAHVETGEPLPRVLFDKMLTARNFQSGLQTLRQVEFALFDMELHSAPAEPGVVPRVLQAVRDEVAVLQPPAYNRTAHTFGHVFAGGYSAGYYSYKWAEVLASDAYGAFEEARMQGDVDGSITGARYQKEILQVGGSRPAMVSFKAFRGREPSIDALLRHQGMA